MSDVLRFTCMLVCALFVHIAHETAGAARARSSLRPLTIEGEEFPANLGRNASRDREAAFWIEMPHTSTIVIPGCATWRRPGIHRAAELVDQWIPSPSGCPGMTRGYRCSRSAPARHPQTKTRRVTPPRSKSLQRKVKPPYSSSSAFFPPIVFSFANTASTLRSSRCFSVGSNSGSFLVVSDAGSRGAPP